MDSKKKLLIGTILVGVAVEALFIFGFIMYIRGFKATSVQKKETEIVAESEPSVAEKEGNIEDATPSREEVSTEASLYKKEALTPQKDEKEPELTESVEDPADEEELVIEYKRVQESDTFYHKSLPMWLKTGKEENIVYSPLTTYAALAILADTANGETRDILLDTLKCDSIADLRVGIQKMIEDNSRETASLTSVLGNSLWVSNKYKIVQKEKDLLVNAYGLDFFTGKLNDPIVTKQLQDWLNEKTKGLLEDKIKQESLPKDTLMAIFSTIYFKGGWNSRFYETSTVKFSYESGKKQNIEMMERKASAYHYVGENFCATNVSIQDGGNLWILLPNEGVSTEALSKDKEALDFLSADNTQRKEASPVADVHLLMPDFSCENKFKLTEGLEQLGLSLLQDFSSLIADTDTNKTIKKIEGEHTAKIKIDNEGLLGVAYTKIIERTFGTIGGDKQPVKKLKEIEFIVNRPFVFGVTGKDGSLLFTGIINDPEQE